MSAELELKAYALGCKRVLKAAQALASAALAWDEEQTSATHEAIAELKHAEAFLEGALAMAKASDAPIEED